MAKMSHLASLNFGSGRARRKRVPGGRGGTGSPLLCRSARALLAPPHPPRAGCLALPPAPAIACERRPCRRLRAGRLCARCLRGRSALRLTGRRPLRRALLRGLLSARHGGPPPRSAFQSTTRPRVDRLRPGSARLDPRPQRSRIGSDTGERVGTIPVQRHCVERS
mgnify:CR=1 FL=1